MRLMGMKKGKMFTGTFFRQRFALSILTVFLLVVTIVILANWVGGFGIDFVAVLQVAVLFGLVAVGTLSHWYRDIRKRWVDENRLFAAAFLVLGFLLVVGFTTWSLRLEPSVIVAALIGAVIPGVYYAYKEIINRPSIEISTLDFENANIAPMFVDNIPHLARPTIFTIVEVENKGRATAVDCTLKLWFERDNEVEATTYARWAIPEGKVRYNLLPGESLSVHIVKVFLTKDVFLLCDINENIVDEINFSLDNGSVRDLVNRQFQSNGVPNGEFRLDIRGEWGQSDDCFLLSPTTSPGTQTVKNRNKQKQRVLCREPVAEEDIREQICFYYPRRKAPEEPESVRGGWLGGEIREGSYTLKLQPIAENYKKPKEELHVEGSGSGDLHLTLESIAEKVANEEIEWQPQWTDKGYGGFRQKVILICGEIINSD